MLFQITAAVLQIKNLSKHYDKKYFKLRHFYYKLRQKIIRNYIKNLLQITAAQISPNIDNYYKLCQFSKLLQITSKIIANYGSCFKPKHY